MAGRGRATDRILFGALAGLFEVSDTPGTPSPLTILGTSRGESSHRWPQVLPGGRFLYWVQSKKPDVQGIYAASLAKPADSVKLVSGSSNALYAPAVMAGATCCGCAAGPWSRRSLDLATLKLVDEPPHRIADPVTSVGVTGQMNVSASTSGLLLYSAFNTLGQFTWIDRTDPEKRPLVTIGEPGEYGGFRLSPDRSRIAAMRDRPGGTDIWLLEVERGVVNPFTSPPDSFVYPVWSPKRLDDSFDLLLYTEPVSQRRGWRDRRGTAHPVDERSIWHRLVARRAVGSVLGNQPRQPRHRAPSGTCGFCRRRLREGR